MVTVYTARRKEPRVKLNTRVRITSLAPATNGVSFDTITLDVSPHGASVRSAVSLPVGTEVQFAALQYPFEARAVVRSVSADRTSEGYVLGVEYAGGATNPVVVWKETSTPPARKP